MSDGEFRDATDAELVDLIFAAGQAGIGHDQRARSARARVALTRREREYAEEQEQSRRKFETDLFNAESERQVKRQAFEEALAQRQMDHAASLADKQLAAAVDSAKATKRAAWAAAISAFGALVLCLIAASQLWTFVESERASLTIYPIRFSGGLVATKPIEDNLRR